MSVTQPTVSKKAYHASTIAHIASPQPHRALCGAQILNIPTRASGRCIVCADLAHHARLTGR